MVVGNRVCEFRILSSSSISVPPLEFMMMMIFKHGMGSQWGKGQESGVLGNAHIKAVGMKRQATTGKTGKNRA